MIIQVISDIHGQYSKLQKALEEIKDQPYDLRIYLGDYFDRESVEEEKKMILWLLENIDNEKHIFIIGNHDLWFYYYLEGHMMVVPVWTMECNGGTKTRDAFLELEKEKPEIRDLLYKAFIKMDWIVEIEDKLVLTHGGFTFRNGEVITNDNSIYDGGIFGDFLIGKKIDSTGFNETLPEKFKDTKFILGHWIAWHSFPQLIEQDIIINYSQLTEKNINQQLMPYNIKGTNVYLVDNGAIASKDIGLHFYTFNTEKMEIK